MEIRTLVDNDGISTFLPESELYARVESPILLRSRGLFRFRAKHGEQMVTSYVFATNLPPLREHILCERHGVSDICFNQFPSGVVVGSLAVLLKLLKSCDDIDKFVFNRGWVSLVLRRKRSISHRPVIEHAPQSRTLIGEFPMLDEILYEQMK